MIISSDQLDFSRQQRRLYELEDKLRLLKMILRAPDQNPCLQMATRALQAAYLWPAFSERIISEAEDVMEHAIEGAIHDAVTPRLGMEYENALTCSTAVTRLKGCDFITEEEARVLKSLAQAADDDECSQEDVNERNRIIKARRERIRNERIHN